MIVPEGKQGQNLLEEMALPGGGEESVAEPPP